MSGPQALSIDATVVVSSDQVHRKLGDESVILGLQRGMYYGVDDVGTRIWELLQQPVEVATIRDTLVEEYDVEHDRCERDLLSFLSELLQHALIEVR